MYQQPVPAHDLEHICKPFEVHVALASPYVIAIIHGSPAKPPPLERPEKPAMHTPPGWRRHWLLEEQHWAAITGRESVCTGGSARSETRLTCSIPGLRQKSIRSLLPYMTWTPPAGMTPPVGEGGGEGGGGFGEVGGEESGEGGGGDEQVPQVAGQERRRRACWSAE